MTTRETCAAQADKNTGRVWTHFLQRDDPETAQVEGPRNGRNVTIRINGLTASTIQWFEGGITSLEINAHIERKAQSTIPGGIFILP